MADAVSDGSAGRSTVIVVNPSPDVYGADLQMLQTVIALVRDGWRVVVVLPEDGPLVPRITAAGAEVTLLRFPVLRKNSANPWALVRLLAAAVTSLPRAIRLVRRRRPSVLFVNTVTLPWWILVGRLTRTPTVGHLHEAETQANWVVQKALLAPLFLADAVVVISQAVLAAMTAVQPRLARKAHLIYNGVPGPPEPPKDPPRTGPWRLAVVGRLSPRKASHVALEAVGRLRATELDVILELAGTAFAGYEWYERQLHEIAQSPDLAGRVIFPGYCSPIWPVLQRADIVLAPSTQEPFGNVVVEAQLARRPVVAAAALGHLESITDDQTGLLVAPGDGLAMAKAVRRLITEPELGHRLADRAEREAHDRFSVERYHDEVVALVRSLARGGPARLT